MATHCGRDREWAAIVPQRRQRPAWDNSAHANSPIRRRAMAISKVTNVYYVVPDMDAALAFYRDTLGLA
ncbi:MAG TPA: hypothetical protein VHN38_09965, partial [Immundisolibacter sp.]|nr:hypothetical protein [Immundisolibacter sp.]